MREMYQRYGQVLFIDGTYNLNDHNYACYFLVVENGFDQSEVVACALTAYERSTCIKAIIDTFKSKNNIDATTTVMIDKDLVEHNIISECMQKPVLYFRFHVIKIFKLHYPKNSDKEKCEEIITKMIYVERVEQYLELLEQLKALKLSKTFIEYFTKNWETCADKWVFAYRNDLPIGSNNTNNRVETLNKVIKQFVKLKTSVHDDINCMLSFLDRGKRRAEVQAWNERNKLFVTGSNDAVRKDVIEFCTEYAANKVLEQYDKSKNGVYIYEIVDNNVQLKTSKSIYRKSV